MPAPAWRWMRFILRAMPWLIPQCLRRHHRYSAFAPLNVIRRAISKSAPRLLIAGDDRAAFFLSALSFEATHDEAALLDFSFGKPFLFERLGNRNFFIAECARAGVRVAETIPVSDADGLERAMDRLGLPAVVKRDCSWGGEGVVIAETREAARTAWQRLSAAPARLHSVARASGRRDPQLLADAFRPRARSVGLQLFRRRHSRHQQHRLLGGRACRRQSFRCRANPVAQRPGECAGAQRVSGDAGCGTACREAFRPVRAAWP